MNIHVFERRELKYLIGTEQRRALEAAIRLRMEEDSHGRNTIMNIYFDTPDMRIIRRSLEKPVYKEKLRLRAYGPTGDNEPVFLELKKKYKKTVYKRRVSLMQSEALSLICGESAPPRDTQIAREIAAFLSHYPPLFPSALVTCRREAFVGTADAALRITFDEDLLFRTERLSLSGEISGTPLLKENTSLLEIKATGAVPLWLCRALSELGVYRRSFSKYGKGYLQYIQPFREVRYGS